MSRRALVFLRKRGFEGERYIGPKVVDPAPSLGGRVTFLHDGLIRAGRVGGIQPPSWSDDCEVTPAIRVVED
jgi:hypothetical protein